jgi:hypothetical protein
MSNTNNPAIDFYRFPDAQAAVFPPERVVKPPIIQHAIACKDTSLRQFTPDGPARRLPIDASRIVDDLRFERYQVNDGPLRTMLSKEVARKIYYCLRPALPDRLRRTMQRTYLRNWDKLSFPNWPVDTSVENILEQLLLARMGAEQVDSVPFVWFWPDGATGAAIMTHDVEAIAGLDFVPRVMDLDDEFGIKASFQLVPEQRYPISKDLFAGIRNRDFEINVHGLNHSGNLFSNRKAFLRQAELITQYAKDFGAKGFRSACMYRNADWIGELGVLYDMSVPNVAHFEPQRGGCCTVFPYFVGGVVELPLTTIQDYSLFHILGDYSIDLWKKQVQLILEKHGLISFIVHPDYLLSERARSVYRALLGYLSELRRERNIWMPLPGDLQYWWRERHEMKLVLEEGKWHIVGPGWERARIAFASVRDGRIAYTLDGTTEDVEVNSLAGR